jgi:parallel beta-helix repeat protein
VAVSSWDPDRSGPDTDTRVPSTVAPRGRAFIQASSFKDGSGVHNATMNIAHSDLGYLGFYASESYGVSYKAQQCTHTNLAACDEEKVLGKEVDSRFHDNYMGTYTWGAYGMAITGNSYDHNTMYGLDMHDVTRNMNIDHNHSSYNGDHGIICSQKCDSLKITNNESDHNGMVKWSGPNPDAESGGQVHGIMLHRGVTNSEITGNKVHDQPNGSGIAIFDSKGVLAKNNILDKNYYGIRLSVGTADGVFSHNTISHSTQYAIFTYTGSDSTENTPTPRPTGNTFSDNTIAGTNSYVVRLNQTDGTQFIDNTVTAPGGAFFTSESTGTVLRHNTFPNSQSVVVLSSSKTAGVMTVDEPTGPLGVQLDADSTCEFTSKSGTLFSAAGKSIRTKAASTGSNLHLTSALLGTNPVAVSPQKVAVLPSAGSLSAFADGLTVTINGQTTSKSVKFTISGLTEGTKYKVNRDGTVVGTYTADSDGRISFSNKPPTSASTKYTVVS